jgi:hypothetical protein
MTRIRSLSWAGASTPSSDGGGLGRNFRAITVNGVSTIDRITVAVKMALCGALMTPIAAAVE